MSETRYIISDASKMIDVEPHVLRYWEEELGMEIPRNELGHRYYTDKEVRLFTMIRDLKEKGFQLKAIKIILSAILAEEVDDNIISLDDIRKIHEEPESQLEDEDMKNHFDDFEIENQNPQTISSEDKLTSFKYALNMLLMQSLEKNNKLLADELAERVTSSVLKEMDYLLRLRDEQENQRYRQMDEIMRKKQKGYRQAAVAKAPSFEPGKRKSRWFSNREF